jgi:hypothetical protein
MRYLSCFLLVLLLGCRVDNTNAVSPEQIKNAFIYDSSMYADGCELHLQIDSDNPPNTGPQYLPTAASLPLIKRVIAELAPDPREFVRIPVTI